MRYVEKKTELTVEWIRFLYYIQQNNTASKTENL